MSEPNPKILIVDDDDDIVWMLTAVLRKEYEVLSASDGRTALNTLQRDDIAAVIANHMMPAMGGIELLNKSQELRPEAARILIAATERVNVVRDAVNRARIHRLLTKPLRLTELPATLAEAIREARLEAENTRLVRELAEKNRQLNEANEQLEGEVRQRTRELQRAVEQLEELALRDGLTGLYNHRHFQEVLDAEIARARRHGHKLGFLFLDVDHFKSYNDKNGHPAGDRLLKRIADLLTGGRDSGMPVRTRVSDVVARYGGEEIVMILPETGLEGTLTKAERVRTTIASYPFEHAHTQPLGRVSVSIGAVVFPDHGEDRRSLIDAADRQLYRAKHAGRDRVACPGDEQQGG